MAQGLTTSTLELLGYRDIRQTHTDNVADVFSATYTAGIETKNVQFAYIKTRTQRGDLGRLAFNKGLDTHFVVADSSHLVQADIDGAFPGANYRLYSLADLVWAKVHSAFSVYIEGLRAGLVVEPHFVQPRTEKPNSMPDTEIIDFLASRTDAHSPGSVLVLRAPAAVGKTTLCRMVASKLLQSVDQFKAIPIFIESSHWSQLRLETTHDLWEIVRNSLLRYAPDLQITKSLFETALRTGYIVYIFDGLDELCGRRDATFNALDLVDELASIVADSSARAMVSTRTAYWDAEIRGAWPNVFKLDIAPFNKQQAISYFERRFATDKQKRARSKELYERIVQANQLPPTPGGARSQFVNLPACVSLLADIVDRGDSTELAIGTPQGLAQSMLAFLCRRDRQRKALSTPTEAQLFAFAQVAATSSSAFPQYSLDLLTAAGFESSDQERLIDHPLIHVRADGTFAFAYDFLDPFFKAYYLAKFLRSPDTVVESDARQLMQANANGKSAVLEHLAGLLADLDSEQVAKSAAEMAKQDASAASFLLHLGLALTDIEKLNHAERAEFLSVASGQKSGKLIASLSFSGSFERIDLRGYRLLECAFSDCSLSDIAVDSTTVMEKCEFRGDISFGSSGDIARWKQISTISNRADGRSSLVVDFLVDSTESRRRDILLDAFNIALQKFWHGGVPRPSIDRNNWKRGLLSQSPLSELILESFIRFDLISHIVISGTEAGGLLLDRASYPDVQKFMDSRALAGKIASAFDYCLERM